MKAPASEARVDTTMLPSSAVLRPNLRQTSGSRKYWPPVGAVAADEASNHEAEHVGTAGESDLEELVGGEGEYGGTHTADKVLVVADQIEPGHCRLLKLEFSIDEVVGEAVGSVVVEPGKNM